MTYYIGIDPGKSGAMAIINGKNIVTVPYDEEAYADALARVDEKNAFAVVERVSAMPGQGVTSMFSFGMNYGFIQGLLTANRIPFEIVMPQKWKKEFGVTSDKNTSIAVAQRLFPEVSLMRTEKCKKPHDGIAEALLLALFAKRKSQ